MFSLLWRFLPGPAWLRVIILAALAVALVVLLVSTVYPWAAQLLIDEEATVTS